MAAIRSGLTPWGLARCFPRQQSGCIHPRPQLWSHRLSQRSHLHTVFDFNGPSSSTSLLFRRRNERLFIKALVVRHSSSEFPTGGVSVDVPDGGPVLASSSASFLDGTNPVLPQAIPEQMTLQPVSVVTTSNMDPFPIVDSVHPIPLLTQASLDPAIDVAPAAVEVLQAVTTEVRLVELGLAGHTPVGLIQTMLEFLHVDVGIPWWGAIVVGTVVARLMVFPVIVKGQREAAKMHNVMPMITKLNTRLTEAKESGNKFEFAKAYTDLTLFQKKNDINPQRGLLVPLVQAPVFISFFIALRKMSYLPVPSMQNGGALWFMDLTAADPFYILPFAVTGTMFFIVELSAESGLDNPNLRVLKTVFRIMPFVILPLTINFPTAVFTYWLTSNCFTLAQVVLLRHPLIRDKLNIPERIKHPPSAQNEGFFDNMKKGWKNAVLVRQLEERERRIKNHLDLAAKGPLRQTFTHNPMQQTPVAKDKKVSSKEKPWKDVIE
ncbi:mitochondrial inner membrane protein OXA1L [Nerophis lumbriciformis]|uniref:mitochondrial inner membrane protein OXA1L n=1 Tax=Nerophis lumbriciformis TaxID=546530 RepID=UPI002AE04715|nr:mitochondrial inner membrane protein OXA1L-like [Nerophis lumbriciformis]